MTNGRIGIIGGSGLYNIEGITDVENITVETPFGNPSDKFITGKLEGKDVVFLPRHERPTVYYHQIKFSRKYLWYEETWSRKDNRSQCSRKHEERDQTSGYRNS